MNRITLSVVVPTHNRPDQLLRAMESIRRQTRQPDETVVVDDGSTPPVDSTVFDQFPFPVLVVRNAEALGVTAARNIGVQHATGTFVAFIDDDDIWVSTKLEFVETCLTEHSEADAIIHRTGYREPETPSDERCFAVGDPLNRMIREQPPHLDGVVVRRTVHIEHPFDDRLVAAEDLDYLIRLATSGAAMFESSRVLAVFGEDTPSVIDIDSRISGRLGLLANHPEILADSVATSFFYLRLGHLQRRGGMRGQAIGSFLRAIRAKPTSSMAWRGLALSVLP